MGDTAFSALELCYNASVKGQIATVEDRRPFFESKHATDSLIRIILIFCLVAFFLSAQYIITFLTLVLLVVYTRFNDIENLTVDTKGKIEAKFRIADKKVSEIIKSDIPNEKKIDESQKLIDEIFRLGYKAAGGTFTSLNNIKIKRNSNGEVVGVQYDETA